MSSNNSPAPPAPPAWRWRIIGIYPVDADRGAVVIDDYRGRRIVVSVSSDPAHPAVATHLLLRLISQPAMDEACARFAADWIGWLVNVAGGCLLDPVGDPVILDMNLQAILYQETVHFSFRTDGDGVRPYLAPIQSHQANVALFHPGNDDHLKFEIEDDLLVVSAHNVQVLEVLVHAIAFEGRVWVRGQEMHCIAEPVGLFNRPLRRHLKVMQAIEKCRPSNPALARITKLLGYVFHARFQCIVGMLSEWVAMGLENAPGHAPTYADCFRAASRERREKWMTQICETVSALHQQGLVWGDGNLSRVLIDTEDNVRMVCFGGGYVEGESGNDSLAEAMEADDEAIENIAELLGMDDESTDDTDSDMYVKEEDKGSA